MARVKCSECNGTGKETCYYCDGTGQALSLGGRSDCYKCNQTGKLTCEKCNGTGYVEISAADQMYDEASSYIEKENVTENDKKKAAGLFAKAAELGHMEAQYMFGLCYYHVIGVPQDDEKAAFWLRKAAAQGHEDAKKQLKEMGVPLTAPTARSAPAPATQQNRTAPAPAPAPSINTAGMSAEEIYDKGNAVANNSREWRKAIEYYRKAAEMGHMEAQFYMGECYSSGRDVPKDYAKAAEWYCKAAAQGHFLAEDNLDRLKKQGLI